MTYPECNRDDIDEDIPKRLDAMIPFCPFCGKTEHNEWKNYHVETPPLQDTVFVQWQCEDCFGYYVTEHSKKVILSEP